MTNDDKKKLVKLIEERIDDCIKDTLEKGQRCRLDCSHYENCLEVYVLFDVMEELTDDGVFMEDGEKDA